MTTIDPKHLFIACFKRGFKDFLKGTLDLPENYAKDSLYAKEWQRGQNAAYFWNLKRVKYNERKQKNEHYRSRAVADGSGARNKSS